MVTCWSKNTRPSISKLEAKEIFSNFYFPIENTIPVNSALNPCYTKEELSSSAKMQARLHKLDFSSVESFLEKGDDITQNVEQFISKIESILKYGLEGLSPLNKTISLLESNNFEILSPSKIMHLDFHQWNLLYNDKMEIAGVFDFDYLDFGKDVYDLGASLTYFVRYLNNTFNSAYANTQLNFYLSEYNKEKNLSPEEKAKIPYMMILRLVDNLARDLDIINSDYKLTNSNLRNLNMLDWALNLR